MKAILTLFIFLILSTCPGLKSLSQNITASESSKEPKGTAILITGAAARIPQEAALLENLYNQEKLNDVVFISGASSGALNTVMLNAILDKKISWEEYKKILFSITNDSIFKMNGKKLPVDTSPLKRFLTNVLHNKLGYYKIGDLPVPCSISISDIVILRFARKNYRLSNLKINPESDPSLDLVEVLMASTAFPIVFPKAKITHSTTLPDDDFIDGGLVDDHIPFTGLIDFIKYRRQSVEKIIVISRKADSPELSEELLALGINDKGLMDKLGISLDEFLSAAFIKGLKSLQKEAPDLAAITQVYIPAFDKNFLLMDFNNLKLQYDTTNEWAIKNNPVPLSEYLESANKK